MGSPDGADRLDAAEPRAASEPPDGPATVAARPSKKLPPRATTSDTVAERAATTLVDEPRTDERRSGEATAPSRAPLEYLRADEIARTHRFALLGVIIFVGAIGTLPFVSGDPTLEWVFLGSLIVSFVSNLWVIHMTADPRRYTDAKIAAGWMVHAVTVDVALTYYGVFSPLPIITLLLLYFSSLAYNVRLATAFYVATAGFQVALAVVVIGGVVADPGLFRGDYLSTSERLVSQALVQMVLGIAFVLARLSRATTVAKVAEMETAVREGALREAMLHEARMDLDRALRIGDSGRFSGQILGSYKLGVVIGRGAMGEVYEAFHVKTGEVAAVKLLRPGTVDAPAVQRFLRELRVAGAVAAPNIVRVLEIADETSPLPYLAMERLEGRDLAAILRTAQRLEPADVVALLAQVGRGITAAHAAGVVHRDLKPQNLFLADQVVGDPVWKILDFGISKPTESGGTLTHGHIVGTPAYMAPEQAQGLDVDHRVDTYALAAIAYRGLTGHLPFRSRDIPATLHDVVYRMPRRPGALVDLPQDVDLVLAIGLAKDPALRFQSAMELANAVTEAVGAELDPAVRQRARAVLSRKPWS